MRLGTWPSAAKRHKLIFGVDENSALVVLGSQGKNNMDKSTVMRVEGEGGVTILDFTGATVSNSSNSCRRGDCDDSNSFSNGFVSISNVSLSYLTEGDEYSQGQFRIALWKTSLQGREEHERALTSYDIFSSATGTQFTNRRDHPREFVRIACYFFHSKSYTTEGFTKEQHPTFKVVLSKVNGSAGFEGVNTDGQSFTSFINMRVDITPL